MISDYESSFLTGPRDAVLARLANVERRPGCIVALPAAYDRKPNARFPLVLVPRAEGMVGACVEISRLMAETRELHECILVACEANACDTAAMERDARARYRASAAPSVVIEATAIPALTHALRRALSTGRAYGEELVPLRHPLLMRALLALSPIVSRFLEGPAPPVPNPHRFRATRLGRDFEIFVSLPSAAPGIRYPALVVLDANIEFCIASETAARLAGRGEIGPLAVIGVGVPRSEGRVGFALRRFEEFAPPTDGYSFDDDLGRIFRAVFSLRRQDARVRMGRAPDLLHFMTTELLPKVADELPIDLEDVGLLGHSAGATFTLFAMTQSGSPFRRYAAISPGLAMSGHWLGRQPDYAIARRAERAYLCLGGEEYDNAFNRIAGIPGTEDCAKKLRARHPQVDVSFECHPDETHSSVYPRAVESALRALYRPALTQGQRKRA